MDKIRIPLPKKESSMARKDDSRHTPIEEIPESILSLRIWPPGVNGLSPVIGPN